MTTALSPAPSGSIGKGHSGLVNRDDADPASAAGSEHAFRSFDGVELFYRAWLPKSPSSRAVILLHRGHEHSGRLAETARRLALDDAAIFAWDQRGHGRSPGPRGGAPDGSVRALAKDLDCFARHLAAHHGVRIDQTVLVAHSVGAVVAASWVHDYAPPVAGMALLAPAFKVKLYVPLAIPALRLKQAILGPGHVKSYVRSRVLTHDPAERKAYDADPLIFRQIAVDLLLDLHDTSGRLVADAGAITTPTLILAAGKDWVVRLDAQRRFYERLSSSIKRLECFDGMHHALLHELDRHLVVDRVRRFACECFERGPIPVDRLSHADQGGHTRTEYDALRLPASPPAKLKWGAVRAAMATGGRLSKGIRLGFSSGFDSGVTLDYVYADQPAGLTPLGKLVDRSYLNSIGWRGIRARRANLEKLLRRAIDETRTASRPVHIVDIAAGAGRYVLETIKAADSAAPQEATKSTAALRDYRQANLDAAKALAATLGLDDRIDFQLADAFDRASLAALFPRPTIGIVSGLYELFPENDAVRRSLAGLAEAIEPGGLLVYTCQPWHPQMEFIARALRNREGKPWIMRRRTQAEMDALVREAGFEKIEQEIDRWGIFTVCLARRT